MEQRTASNTTLECLDGAARLVHIEGSDDDELRGREEVSLRDGNGLDDALEHGVDVVLELCADWDDGRIAGNRALEEVLDLLVLFLRLLLGDQIDLVLQDDDGLELHDLNGSKMFGRLWLRASGEMFDLT